MIQYKSLTQYTRVVDGIRFPQDRNQPFVLVYFSENSSLLEDYTKLNIRRVDARHIVVPITKIPVTRLNSDLRNGYKKLGLLPYSSNMAFPKDKNIIVDTTYFTNTVDATYKPATYRQRAGHLIQNFLFNTFSMFPPNYKKLFLYSVDVTKPFNTFVNTKIFPLVRNLKQESLYFDDMLLLLVDHEGVRYRSLVRDREYKLARVLQYIRKLKPTNTEEEQEKEENEASNKIINKVKDDVEDSSTIKDAVKTYLKKDPETVEKVMNDEVDDHEINRTTIASILYKVNGDINKARRLANTIPDKNLNTAVKKISKQFHDEILVKQESVNSSENIISQFRNVPELVDEKTPEHIFDKRRLDFETNLKKDMSNAFKVLENRDIPLKFQSITISDKPQAAGELEKSDEATISIKLKDSFGNIHDVLLDIPKIDPQTGTFRVNGKRKCLINQIILNPISFPKPFDSKFESSYSSFHIYSKRTIRLKYLEIYMGSFKLPLSIILSYSFGFDNTMKKYGIKYKIVEDKPGKDEVFTEVPSSYLVFENLDTDVKKELASSFVNARVSSYDVKKEFLTKDYFNDLIIKMTGRVDSTYLINNNLDNIVDPIVKQVLMNQQLPYDLENIIYYMANKVVAGFVQDRNDITNQRIRNSEILVHLAQKQLLTAYTEYREQYLSGNKDAKINFPQSKIITQFSLLEIVQDMEYANPLEEAATITKISPVGKSVGGIPDKEAVQLDARNVHPTYFGNIDPVDTAEGGNIGITQQLTVDAYITSARGLFGRKEYNNNERSGILSTSASVVPFIENNEGARIIMSTNQAKQMLPLKNPEPPIVQTGYESLLTNILSDSFIKRSPCNGKILDVTKDYIDVSCGKSNTRVDITPIQLKSGTGKNTLSTFKPVVTKGQSVKNRQVIAEGSCIANGSIALGRNLACAYMPYKGYNFEDGMVINERLFKEDKLTSLHGVDVEANIEKNDRILYINEIGKDTVKGEILFRKFPGSIDELLGFDEDEDENVDSYDGQIIIKSPGGKIVDIEVFSNIKDVEFPALQALIDRTNKKYKKPANQKYTRRGIAIPGIQIVFKVEQELKIGLGDKLCNRFGNKGIISLIESDDLMPRTPWGERLDIIMNPLGVLNRMNMGQIYELYCGLISRYAANQIIKKKSLSDAINLLGMIMTSLDTTPNQKFGAQFISNMKKMTSSQFKTMLEQIEKSRFIPIIVPPFKAPTYKQIVPLMKKLGLKSGYRLTLPEFNTKTLNEVSFGYLYIAKLEHIGEMKAHSRSTGPTVTKTGQPTGGKAREGGQRFGEGDSWALSSYNATTVLSEMLGPLSDDVVSKNEIITEIIQTGDAQFRQTKASPTRDLLNSYFTSLMIGER